MALNRPATRLEADPEPLWQPLPGPQTHATISKADVTGYGGSAGGGKTEMAIGLALTRHRKSIIFRREYPQLKDVIGRANELLEGRGTRYNGHTNTWTLPDGRTLELGAVQYEQDKNKYRGRAHDLKAFDEATEFTESQFRFLAAWNRTTVEGQRCRVLLTFNPPTSPEGQWVTRYFAAWLDPEHPDPAAPGELRWYARVDDEDVERPDGSPFRHGAETITPQSRTFIPARLSDNPYLESTGYRATLQSLPEPLRSQLLYGDFNVGLEADPWQVIPTVWVQQSNARWQERDRAGTLRGPQTCVGLDVAHGGKDKTVAALRHDDWFEPLVSVPGKETPEGKDAAAVCVKAMEPGVRVMVDAIGIGASAHERLKDPAPEGHGVEAVAVNFAERSEFKDKSGKYRTINKRAEAFWRLREALDPEGDLQLCLPPDQELLADLCAARYEITTAGVKVQDKRDIAKRIGRSPDKGDAVALAMLPRGPVGGPSFAGGQRGVLSGPAPGLAPLPRPGNRGFLI